jgi:hypothetical protein
MLIAHRGERRSARELSNLQATPRGSSARPTRNAMPSRSIVAPEGRGTQEMRGCIAHGACLLPLHGTPIAGPVHLIPARGAPGCFAKPSTERGRPGSVTCFLMDLKSSAARAWIL